MSTRGMGGFLLEAYGLYGRREVDLSEVLRHRFGMGPCRVRPAKDTE